MCLLKRGLEGQSTVELALALPVLILVAVAVCQVAVGLNCYLVVTAASREGARRGAETNDVVETKKRPAMLRKGFRDNPPESTWSSRRVAARAAL